uniref:Phasin family protein n=1 Tax=Archaeoglobus fulgidus TaxID=2234 RepID=A0A7J3M1Q6_ARCFL
MEMKELMEAGKGFYKMGFGIARTSLDLLKVAMDSYVSMYEFYVKQFVPSESFESIRKAIQLYTESQTKVFDNFKKLLDQLEKQQDEIYSRMLEMTPKIEGEKKKT